MKYCANPGDRSERHAVILSLVTVPGRGQPSPPETVLRYFGAADGKRLGLDLLLDALDRRDSDDTEMALIVCFVFGLTADHLLPLLELSFADWHRKHEDVVSALQELHSPDTVPALVHATRWIPDYLDFDENRALAKKAIHALGKTPGHEAEQALIELAQSGDELLRETAGRVLQRRRTT